MLVVGHSAGGNVLLRGLRPELLAAIRAHRPSDIMPSPLGDLVVLVNPATSAADWNALVEAQRRLAGLPPTYRWDGASLRSYTIEQPPVVVSLTSTCPFNAQRFRDWRDYWGGFFQQAIDGLRGTADPACDWVTAFALPLAQMVLNDERAYGRTAMGQLVPATDAKPIQLFGTTHGVELSTSAATSLKGSTIEASNRCGPADHWLYRARSAKPRAGHNQWDTGYGANGLITIRPRDQVKGWTKLQIQFVHGAKIYRRANLIDAQAITSGTDPFWNVAAHANTIEGHGSYVSYQLWCALNQLVLDAPAEPDP
jgi:hypothetical protein